MFNVINKFGQLNVITRNVINHQLRIRCQNYSDDQPTTEKSLNSVTLLGRVGLDPQARGTEEHPVVTFSLATNTSYRIENGDRILRTDWHKVVVFKPGLRDACLNYLTKGQRTLVNGRISYTEMVDRDGKNRIVTNIVADDVIFLTGRPKSETSE